MTSSASLDLKRATFSSRGFVAENVNGLGGDFARYASGVAQRSFKPWQPTILAEFRDVADYPRCKPRSAKVEVHASLDKMMRQAMAARVEQLQAQAAGGAARGLADPGLYAPQMVEVPCVSGSVSIEIPVSVRISSPHRDLSAGGRVARIFEHFGLVEHSVHFIAHATVHVIAAVASSHKK